MKFANKVIITVIIYARQGGFQPHIIGPFNSREDAMAFITDNPPKIVDGFIYFAGRELASIESIFITDVIGVVNN